MRKALLACATSVLVSGLLSYNVAVTLQLSNWRRRLTDLWTLSYWQEASVAIRRSLDRQFPEANEPEIEPPSLEGGAAVCKRLVMDRIEPPDSGFQPWRVWQTLPWKPFLRVRKAFPLALRSFSDGGRAVGLALGFQLFGGVAPFLVFWLSPLASLPLVAWVAAEFIDAGRAVAGTAFLLLFALSSYVVDCFWWPHSAIGFYLIALLTLVGIAVYAVFGRRCSIFGLTLRIVATGTAFAVCVTFRSGALLLVPGFLVAVSLGVLRVIASRGSPPGRHAPPWFALLSWIAAALALFAAPYALLREPRHHAVWISIWEGLGDFDETKGHSWHDPDAIKALHRAGLAEDVDENKDWALVAKWVTDPVEDFFRASVLRDIQTDPGWYAAILGRRVLATLTQARLWRPRQGGLETKDLYYSHTSPANSFELRPWQVEIPMALLLGPTAGLVLLWAVSRWVDIGRDLRDHVCKAVAVLASVGTAATIAPVLITTAAAEETQAFALVYFLGLAFAFEGLQLWARSPRGTRARDSSERMDSDSFPPPSASA